MISKEYETREAGLIDLLCKDRHGYRCDRIKKGRIGHEVVDQTLKYSGWVQKHLSEKVRGIVIVNERDEKLLYAALPLKDLLKIKYYRVSFGILDKYGI